MRQCQLMLDKSWTCVLAVRSPDSKLNTFRFFFYHSHYYMLASLYSVILHDQDRKYAHSFFHLITCTLCLKKTPHLVLSIALPNINRFSKFFHWHTFSRPTSLSTMVMFSSVRACFGLQRSCLWSVLPVMQIFFSKVSCLSLLQFIFENFVTILCELVLVFKQCLVFIAKWHVTSITSTITCIKITICNNIVCFCL